MKPFGQRQVLHLACGVADARGVIRGRTAGLLSEAAVAIGMTPRRQATGMVVGTHVRIRPRPREYAPARTLFSPSLVGRLRPTADGATDLTYRIAPGAGMALIWVLAGAAAIFWVVALAARDVLPVLPAAFFTIFLGVFVFLFLLTRSMKGGEDRALSAWTEDVVAGCRQAGAGHRS
jgi:hypothetical protein